jgi:hypothetical protein
LWAKEQCIQKHFKIDKLEEDPKIYYQEKSHGVALTDVDLHIKLLEEECTKLLQLEEELWRQRSRVIWIKSVDQNTKKFHQFASNRRNRKTIWEIQDENNLVHSGQEEIKKEATRYYKYFYSDTRHNKIIEQISTVQLFPLIV